jgi:hypothetical protein
MRSGGTETILKTHYGKPQKRPILRRPVPSFCFVITSGGQKVDCGSSDATQENGREGKLGLRDSGEIPRFAADGH